MKIYKKYDIFLHIGLAVIIMGLDHFQRFLYAFAEDYSESYEKLSELGDFFYLTDSERDFEKWLEQNGRSFCSERSNIPIMASKIRTKSNADSSLPLYAIALNEFFYDEFEYLDENFREIPKKHGFISHKMVAETIYVPRTLITSWKSGIRTPKKYEWWALGIRIFRLDYQLIQPYLYLIGKTVNVYCIDDILLFYSMCTEKEPEEIYGLLKKYNCHDTAMLFAPTGSGHKT